MGQSAGEALARAAVDGELDDGSDDFRGIARRTGFVVVIRVGVGIVVVVVVVCGASHQLPGQGGGSSAEAALLEQLAVDAAAFVLAEAVLEGVLELVEGEVSGAARIGPVEEGAMFTVRAFIHYVTPRG